MVRGCSDHSNDLNMSSDSLTTHRPPQPLIINTCSSKYSFSLAEAPPAGHVSKEGYRETDIAQAPVSSRWNPTPEQVEVLKEMYRLGTRTPTAEHIQQITTLLRRFGRVEGKNVFYWFQNHKARERQRRRRERVETSSQEQKCNVAETRERKKSGLRKACCEVEESSNWLPLPISKCNSLSEEHVSAHRAPTSTNGWTQFEEREFHRIKTSTVLSLDMWLHMMELPSPMSFMSTTSTSSLTLKPTASTEDHGNQARQYQTLELFPLRGDNVSEKQSQASITTMNTSFRPNQFVEYLPPKV